jgi:hypothetical protein
VRVAHHHAKATMAQELGDRPERGSLHDEPGREGVPQVVPGEVLDVCHLERRLKRVLDVLNRFARLTAGRMRERVGTVRKPLVEQGLQRREHRRIQRHRVGTAALGPGNAENAVQKIHWFHRRWNKLPRRNPVCTDRMIFSAKKKDPSTFFAACRSRASTATSDVPPPCQHGYSPHSRCSVRSTTNASRVHEVVVVLDSCFSGAMGNLPEANNAAAVLREGISILTASRGDQVSLESRVADLIDMLIPAGAVASAGIATYRPNTGFIMMASTRPSPSSWT